MIPWSNNFPVLPNQCAALFADGSRCPIKDNLQQVPDMLMEWYIHPLCEEHAEQYNRQKGAFQS
jgi:hypothetical protein